MRQSAKGKLAAFDHKAARKVAIAGLRHTLQVIIAAAFLSQVSLHAQGILAQDSVGSSEAVVLAFEGPSIENKTDVELVTNIALSDHLFRDGMGSAYYHPTTKIIDKQKKSVNIKFFRITDFSKVPDTWSQGITYSIKFDTGAQCFDSGTLQTLTAGFKRLSLGFDVHGVDLDRTNYRFARALAGDGDVFIDFEVPPGAVCATGLDLWVHTMK